MRREEKRIMAEGRYIDLEAAELVRRSASLLYDDIEDEKVDRLYEQELLLLRRRGVGEHSLA